MKYTLVPQSLYTRVLIALILSITVVLAGITAFNVKNSQARLTDELRMRAQTEAGVLAQAASVFYTTSDRYRLRLLASTASESSDEISYVAFYADNDALLAHGYKEETPIEARQEFADLLEQVRESGAIASRMNGDYLEYAKPIFTHTYIGTVALRLNTEVLQMDRVAALKQGILTALILAVVLFVLVGSVLRQFVIVPLRRLSAASEEISAGGWVSPPGQERQDELGQLARSFGHMLRALHAREAQLQEQVSAVQEMNEELDTRVIERTHELHEMVEKQEQLLQQVRQMSTPVVPVLRGILVVPIIGNLDTERAEQLIQKVLEGIDQHRARIAILDITGVPVVDTSVAEVLIHVARSAQLLGTHPVLVGIRPEVAQTLVQLGVDLSSLRTYSTLQEALELTGVHWANGHAKHQVQDNGAQ